MVKSIKEPTIGETQLSIKTNNCGEAFDLPGNFEFLTHMASAMALAQLTAPDYMIDEFRDRRAQRNILRSVQGPLRSVA